MSEDVIVVIVVAIILILIVALLITRKKVKAKKETIEKAKNETMVAEQKKQQEEILNAWKDKISNKEVLKKWIVDILVYCKTTITQSPNHDHFFDFYSYAQDFTFGHHFRRVYYPHLKRSDFISEPIYILNKHFAEFDLPELDKDADANNFTNAIATIVKERLEQEGIKCSLNNGAFMVTYRDGSYEDDSWAEPPYNMPRQLYTLHYERKKTEGSW